MKNLPLLKYDQGHILIYRRQPVICRRQIVYCLLPSLQEPRAKTEKLPAAVLRTRILNYKLIKNSKPDRTINIPHFLDHLFIINLVDICDHITYGLIGL